MATRIFIKGNFLIARSDLNNNSFIRVPKSDVIPFRDEFDNFGFFDRNTLARIEGFQKLTQLGRIEEWNIDNEFPPSQTVFPFSDIVDELGAPYLSADDLDSLLLTNLGACATGGGGGGITYVATDATLSGDGTPGFPLSVVPIISAYDERFDPFLAIVGNVWETLIVPNTPIHKLITVIAKTSTANVIVGVRMVGSGLNRRIQIDGESATSFNVSTDMFGQIEVYSSNIGSTDFYVTSYLF